MPDVLFDDALPTLVRILAEHGGPSFVERGTILRDATGRLAFFSRDPRPKAPEGDGDVLQADQTDDYSPQELVPDPLAQRITEGLGPYARAHRPVVYQDDVGASTVLDSDERIPVQVEDDLFCQLIDRRIVGSGWLAEPATAQVFPPRLVFATLKGGVGRSTALTVIAADLARRNRNVLVVDLDLEAPGLGHLLLDEDRLPQYGVIDFLVENGVGGVKDERLHTFLGTSHLTGPDGGRVDVIPAIGRRSAASPENILAKLSRAMIEDVGDNGSVSVGQQVSSMIDRFAALASYDAVLIDSRAGLAELAAPAVIGLGATVLLFGTAQTQTIEGYRALFSGLKLLAQRDRMQGRSAEWRTALRPVYAKASMNGEAERRFRDELYELYSEFIYDAERDTSEEDMVELDALRFTRDDEKAPHWPLVIPFNQAFIEFDPARAPGQLTAAFYEQSFRPLLDAVDNILSAARLENKP